MSSIALFPFQEDIKDNCLERANTVVDTLVSAMKAWILTKKGSRVGNMVGCFLPDIIHDLVGYSSMGPLSEQLQRDLSQQFPEATFLNVLIKLDLTQKFVDLRVSITFSTPVTDIYQFEIEFPSTQNIN